MSDSNIQVCVRVRPLLSFENPKVIVETDENSTTLTIPPKRTSVFDSNTPGKEEFKKFIYHQCFGIDSTQEEVFDSCGRMVLDNLFNGYHGCVFAYGQTGSGKSHTMMGNNNEPGLIPRLGRLLFERVKLELEKAKEKKLQVYVTFMEIYNEKIQDLLLESSQQQLQSKKKYKIRQQPLEGVYVEGLQKMKVESFDDLLKYLEIGNKTKTIRETAMNAQSSRSHSIFSIYLLQEEKLQPIQVNEAKGKPPKKVIKKITSKIHLVDLAGSERITKSKTSGLSLKEGVNINQSLTSLSLVIKALVERQKLAPEKQKQFHVPYRDSLLTWLLREALGGNAKTVMLATISPSLDHIDETLSTLRYAAQAQEIVNTVKQNLLEEESQLKSLIRTLREENLILKQELEKYKKNNTISDLKEEFSERRISFDLSSVGDYSDMDEIMTDFHWYLQNRKSVISNHSNESEYENGSSFEETENEGSLVEKEEQIQASEIINNPKEENEIEKSEDNENFVSVLEELKIENEENAFYSKSPPKEFLSDFEDEEILKLLPSPAIKNDAPELEVAPPPPPSIEDVWLLVDIPHIEQIQTQSKPYSLYHLQISIYMNTNIHPETSNQLLSQWIVKRRFKEFDHFHKQIQNILPTLLKGSFPQSSWWQSFQSQNNEEFINERRSKLEIYANGIIGWWLENYKLQSVDLVRETSCMIHLIREHLEREMPFFSPRCLLDWDNGLWYFP